MEDLVNEDPVTKEKKRREKRVYRLKKHLQDIERYEKRLTTGERLHKNQIEKITRKDKYREELENLRNAPPPTLQDLAREREYEDEAPGRVGSDDEAHLSEPQNKGSEANSDEENDNDKSLEPETDEKARRASVVENMVEVAVGDRVRVMGNKTGIVRYLGNVEFSTEKLIGIELDHWHPNATDGTVRGKTYFKVELALFFRLSTFSLSLARERSMKIWDQQYAYIYAFLFTFGNTDKKEENEDESTPPPQAPLPKIQFKIGDYVKLARGKTGVVKYIGETAFMKGEIIGLELDTWTPYGHNGTIHNKKYFEANNGRGYFTRRNSISQVVIPLVKQLDPKAANASYQLRPFKAGDRVILKESGETGVVRYVGFPSFAEGEVFGIELDEWSINAHDGTANGEIIFDTAPGHGIFARRDEIDKYDPEKKKLEEARIQLKIGDRVTLTRNRTGVIKYVGTDYVSEEEIVGVELDVWTPGAHDGTHRGYRYFNCAKGRGLFVPRKFIIQVNPIADTDNKTAEDSDNEKEESGYGIGTRVQIDTGMKGTIRYVGRDTQGEEVYGIEMDEKVPKGTDGRHNQMRYFDCRPERGIFVRKHVIVGVVEEDYMTKYTVGDRVKLNRGRYGLIKYIEETEEGEVFGIEIDSWSGEVANAEAGRTRRFSVKYGHSITRSKFSVSGNPMPTESETDNNGRTSIKNEKIEEDDNQDFRLGETVELNNGLIGTIRFIGPVHFDKDDWIGVELHDGRGQHDGAYRGQRYFTCPPKRGVFVKTVKGRRKDDPSRQYLKTSMP
ncbi:hypothetical protein RFI_09516 [Reticulomyxa filosa]|uniref:CAP-Gly domain-containing protein n=1 Tax=Reticulomyxa filosa TaxID=46433 RepID=X6NPJ0_RETFI|nr:hypothetical protein RFI_09516 [Reticulomyxa filosa]|eukprot:ETO27614.1 hypothetical protein RFI_09516 [Reticulomyxa filosa]